jgi:hypothetical protein
MNVICHQDDDDDMDDTLNETTDTLNITGETYDDGEGLEFAFSILIDTFILDLQILNMIVPLHFCLKVMVSPANHYDLIALINVEIQDSNIVFLQMMMTKTS